MLKLKNLTNQLFTITKHNDGTAQASASDSRSSLRDARADAMEYQTEGLVQEHSVLMRGRLSASSSGTVGQTIRRTTIIRDLGVCGSDFFPRHKRSGETHRQSKVTEMAAKYLPGTLQGYGSPTCAANVLVFGCLPMLISCLATYDSTKQPLDLMASARNNVDTLRDLDNDAIKDQDRVETFTLKVTTWNTFMIPVRAPKQAWAIVYPQKSRADKICEWMGQSTEFKESHIVMLQEVWAPKYSVLSNWINGYFTMWNRPLFGRAQIVAKLKELGFNYITEKIIQYQMELARSKNLVQSPETHAKPVCQELPEFLLV